MATHTPAGGGAPDDTLSNMLGSPRGRSSLRLVPTLSPRQPPPVPTAEADEAEAIKLADVERRAAQMTAELEVGDHLDER